MDLPRRILGNHLVVMEEGEDIELEDMHGGKEEGKALQVKDARDDDDDMTDSEEEESKPFFDAPMERVGVGNTGVLITQAAFLLGGLLATGFLLGIVDYLPFPWLVLDICALIVCKVLREALFDRWMNRSERERRHLRASRGLFFGNVDFIISILFGAAYALIFMLVGTTIDWNGETALVQVLIAAYMGIMLIVTLQLPMISSRDRGNKKKACARACARGAEGEEQWLFWSVRMFSMTGGKRGIPRGGASSLLHYYCNPYCHEQVAAHGPPAGLQEPSDIRVCHSRTHTHSPHMALGNT